MYNNLKAEMTRKGVTGEEIAKVLDVHPNSAYSKLNGKSDFYKSECDLIKERFFKDLDFEYLFKKEDK